MGLKVFRGVVRVLQYLAAIDRGGKYFPTDTFVVAVFVELDFPAVGVSHVEGGVNDIPRVLCFVADVDGVDDPFVGDLVTTLVHGTTCSTDVCSVVCVIG